MNYLTKKIKIFIGEPISRDKLSEDRNQAIQELEKLSKSLKIK